MKAFDYDATDYLQKPIAIDRFNASVKELLNI
jgi:DNA-binding response OmpR family regulator